MFAQFRAATMMLLTLSVLTGVIYPLAVTAVAQVAFPRQAQGSLVDRDGKVIGSALIGQQFDDPRYFWGRPSATGPVPYNSGSSGGSNQAATNPALAQAVQERIARLKAADPENAAPIPIDLVTASASGLDPHISPAAAEWQVRRVAKARRIGEDAVRALTERSTEGPTLGFLGQRRVNVLRLNLALDAGASSK